MRLEGKDIYLDTLEREDCETLWNETEVDFEHPTEELKLGLSREGAGAWFEEIQRLQGEKNLRLGIFLKDGRVIGDVALQNIDRQNRTASLGMGMARRSDRGKGCGQQAVRLMLWVGFHTLGLHRITAQTLDCNEAGKRSLERCGLTLEGRERQAVYLNGGWQDRLLYAMLEDEYHE